MGKSTYGIIFKLRSYQKLLHGFRSNHFQAMRILFHRIQYQRRRGCEMCTKSSKFHLPLLDRSSVYGSLLVPVSLWSNQPTYLGLGSRWDQGNGAECQRASNHGSPRHGILVLVVFRSRSQCHIGHIISACFQNKSSSRSNGNRQSSDTNRDKHSHAS